MTNADRVIENGFLLSDWVAEDVDIDGGRECQDRLENEIAYLLP